MTLGAANTTWSNTGSILTTAGGTVDLASTFTEANLTSGTIDGTGGTINIIGTLNNVAGTLVAPDGGGFFTLLGGTINGGTITGGDLLFSTSGGTLNGVTISGNITLPVNTSFTANTNTTFTGGTASFGGNSLHLNGTGTALTIPVGEAWTGNVTVVGGAAGLGMVNNGTITNTAGGNYIYGGGNAGLHLPEHGNNHVHRGRVYAWQTAEPTRSRTRRARLLRPTGATSGSAAAAARTPS